MSEERKRNGCCLQLVDYEGKCEFWCTNRFECDFNPHQNAFSMCLYETRANLSKCTNTEAQNDALNRSAAAINEEQCRRANEK